MERPILQQCSGVRIKPTAQAVGKSGKSSSPKGGGRVVLTRTLSP
jgi:hypothetical protein